MINVIAWRSEKDWLERESKVKTCDWANSQLSVLAKHEHTHNVNEHMLIVKIRVQPGGLRIQILSRAEEPNIAENLSQQITLLITANNYKWTWHPCIGTPVLTRKCWRLQNNGGVKRVRPQEGLGACFPLSSLLQASPQTSPRPCSPLELGSIFLSTEVLETAKKKNKKKRKKETFIVPVSKSLGRTGKKCLMSPSVRRPHL